MPAKMFYESDADLGLLEDKTIGIIGYGSQGHAHALNCKDNGLDVMIGLYEGSKSRDKAESDGLRVGTVEETSAESDIVMILIPDHLKLRSTKTRSSLIWAQTRLSCSRMALTSTIKR